MNIIENYNLQKDKENKYSYSNTYTNELNTYFSNYIKAKKKLREQQEQKFFLKFMPNLKCRFPL